MKKILTLFALIAFAMTAHAQFVVSGQLGGSYSFGKSTPDANFQGFSPITGADTTYHVPADTLTHDNPLSLSAGFKFGYQVGRIQFGLAASFCWSQLRADQKPAEYGTNAYNRVPAHINPMNPNAPITEYEGWYTQRQSSFTIAPYMRYELIQLGDVAFFMELNMYYTKTFQPIRHDYLDWTAYEMPSTIDTTYHITDSATSLGVKLTPGLSWQLTPHCYIDLYFDVLAFTFDKSTHINTLVVDEYSNTSGEYVLTNRTTTTTTTSTTDLGFGVTGSNILSPYNRNWVRVGFNYTF